MFRSIRLIHRLTPSTKECTAARNTHFHQKSIARPLWLSDMVKFLVKFCVFFLSICLGICLLFVCQFATLPLAPKINLVIHILKSIGKEPRFNPAHFTDTCEEVACIQIMHSEMKQKYTLR